LFLAQPGRFGFERYLQLLAVHLFEDQLIILCFQFFLCTADLSTELTLLVLQLLVKVLSPPLELGAAGGDSLGIVGLRSLEGLEGFRPRHSLGPAVDHQQQQD
jgi:hypothetical protein